MAERVWTVKDALDWTVEFLERKADEHPRRSAEWLLSSATGLSRVELYAYHDRPLSADERERYRTLVAKRAQGMPLQYVTGEMPFRHLVIHVEPGVFIPRPETEILVDEVLAYIRDIPEPVVVDLCTGSGCVAVSIAAEHPGARVWAVDLSEEAVEAAALNARYARVDERVTVLQGDLFGPLPPELVGVVDVVVSNPPYIPSADLPDLPAEVLGFEPHRALDGGPDGLDVVRRIAGDAPAWLRAGGLIALETDTACAAEAARTLGSHYDDARVLPDLTGRDRIVRGRLR